MYPVNKPLITKQDIESVTSALNEGWISGDGPVVQEFETRFAELVDRKFGVAVCNGSVALDLAFEVLNLPEGSEVILPSFAIVSCLAPILRQKLSPIFVDADSSTWNVDLEKVYTSISPKTSAILVVHTYGLGSPLNELESHCRANGIYLIEDAAEAHGVRIQGRPAGSFGDISTFSFYANKLITTGEGGMVLTNDVMLSNRLSALRNLAFKKEKRFIHDEIGHNFRLSSLQAALGISQLSRIEKTVEHRVRIANTYKQQLLYQNLFKFQPSHDEHSNNVYWVVGILLGDKIKAYKDELVHNLAVMGIQTRPFFYPLNKQPLLKKYSFEVATTSINSETLYECGFYLPSGNGYTLDEIIEISAIFNAVMAELIKDKNVGHQGD